MGRGAEETLTPIAIVDAQSPGINCASIVLNCAGSHFDIRVVVFGAQPPKIFYYNIYIPLIKIYLNISLYQYIHPAAPQH